MKKRFFIILTCLVVPILGLLRHSLLTPAGTLAVSLPRKPMETTDQAAAAPQSPAAPASTTSVGDQASKQARLASLPQAQQPAPRRLPGMEHGQPWKDITGWQTLPPRERLVQLLRQPFAIMDRGTIRPLELARDELFVRDPARSPRAMHPIPAQADAEGVLKQAEAIAAATGQLPRLVFYPPGTTRRSEHNRRLLSDQILVPTSDLPRALQVATQVGLKDAKPLAGASGYMLARDQRFPGAALVAAADFHAQGFTTAEAQLAAQLQPRAALNDPLYPKQWHLKQTGLNHINVENVWSSNQGSSVVIGIIDDGLEYLHADLNPNAPASITRYGRTDTLQHIDILDGDSDPSPYAPEDDPNTEDENEAEYGDSHGTSVAGLAAARGGNGIGVAGVAPLAKLVGIRLTAGATTAAEEAEAMGYDSDIIDIKNNSWGPTDVPWVLGTIAPAVKSAFRDAVATGRRGLGSIITWAAGNGRENRDDSNRDAYANSIEVFAIGALTKSGLPASYSEYGANLIVSTPADGVFSTDLSGKAGYNPTQQSAALTQLDYTNSFNGTSAATPVASGVIALMLEANPNLGWRDVKEILLRSSRKVAPTDSEWVSRSGGRTGLPPIKHNPKYGGGMADAAAAVAMSAAWSPILPPTDTPLSVTVSGDTPIPDNSSALTKVFSFSSAMRVEHVEVTFDAHHTYRGDLEIQLISPSGTISTLSPINSQDGGEEILDFENETPLPADERGFFDWVYSSVRHWGESSVGDWKLVIKDKVRGDSGTFHYATVTLHGFSAPAATIDIDPVTAWVSVGTSNTLFTTASGYPDLVYQWQKVSTTTANIAGQTTDTLLFPGGAALSDAANYKVTVTNATGSDTSSTATLGVYRPAPAHVYFTDLSTAVISASAAVPAGASVSYAWFKNGNPLTDDSGPTPRITGSSSSSLRIASFSVSDEATYRCEVTLNSLPALDLGSTEAHVRQLPVINTASFPSDLIVSSATLSLPLDVTGDIASVTITGLPAGLTYDKRTGLITGIPTEPVTNKPIKIKVTNLKGSTETTLLLTIAALPARFIGSFDGTVQRDALANGNFGGSILVSTKPTGDLTGDLYLAGVKLPFKGKLTAAAGADATARVLVSRNTKPVNTYHTLDLVFGRTTGALTGSILTPFGSATALDVEGWRSPYHAQNKAPVGSIVGRHNFLISPPSGLASKPEGVSHGTLSISDLGKVSVSLTPADNSGTVTFTASIGEDGSIPIHRMLAGNTASIQGRFILTDAATNTLGGVFTWYKPIAPTASVAASKKLYPGAFDFGVANSDDLDANGCEYKAPSPGTILWGVRLPNLLGPLDTNLQLTFTLGDIATSNMLADLNEPFRCTDKHALTPALPNNAKVVLKLTPGTGLFSGTATLKETSFLQTRALTFSGVIVPTLSNGQGFFVAPRKLTGPLAPIPMTLGKVTLTEKP